MSRKFYNLIFNGCRFKKRLIIKKGQIKIEKYGVTVIKGDNGTGKSTLLKKLFKLTENKATYIAQENEEVFKGLTLINNITLGQSEISEERVAHVIKKYGLEHILDKNIRTLSGGEKRIISLLRGVLSFNDLIFMDEPTNDLDYRMVEILINIIKDFKNEKTFVIVTHDERLIDNSTKVYVINNSELKEISSNYEVYEEKEESLNDLESKKKVIDNKIISKIFKTNHGNCLLLFLFGIVTLISQYEILEKMDFSIERIKDNQIEICNTLYDKPEVLVKKGYLPTSIISYLNKDISKDKLESIIIKSMDSTTNDFFCLSLDIPKTDNYQVYDLGFVNIKTSDYYYLLNECTEKVLMSDLEKIYLNTEKMFYMNKEDKDSKKEEVEFSNKLYEDTYSKIRNLYGNDLEKIFIIVSMDEKYDFYDFIGEKQFKSMWEGNYYIRSNETIVLAETAIRIHESKSIFLRWAIFSILLYTIIFINSIIQSGIVIKQINILKNYGFEKKDVLNAIRTRYWGKGIYTLFYCVVQGVMLILLLFYGKVNDIREMILLILFIVFIFLNKCIQKLLYQYRINNIYKVEGEFEC